MFQRTYTLKTDVWSAGVTLYVLVAGFPADNLQKMFNLLHMPKGRNLRKLQNLPSDMPDSYYEMLEGLLTYRHKQRPLAGAFLDSEFVQFHRHLEERQDTVGLSVEDISSAAVAGDGDTGSRTASILLAGSVDRHGAVLNFKRFERSLTTVLATMLPGDDLDIFLKLVGDHIDQAAKTAEDPSGHSSGEAADNEEGTIIDCDEQTPAPQQKRKHLEIIRVSDLKSILKSDMKNTAAVIEATEKLSNEKFYGAFAYNVTLLREAHRDSAIALGKRERARARSRSSAMKRQHSSLLNLNRTGRFIGGGRGSNDGGSNFSAQSASSFRFGGGGGSGRFTNSPNDSLKGAKQERFSVHGSNVYATIGKMVSRRSQPASVKAATP